jgi:hypothetical protein
MLSPMTGSDQEAKVWPRQRAGKGEYQGLVRRCSSRVGDELVRQQHRTRCHRTRNMSWPR